VQITTGITKVGVDFANRSSVVGSWRNPNNPLDFDDNGGVFPLDALLIINELNQPVYRDPITGALPEPPAPIPAYFDVDGDGFVVPTDAILVINFLNSNQNPNQMVPAAEAEPASMTAADQASVVQLEPSGVESLFADQRMLELIAAAMASDAALTTPLVRPSATPQAR
jgi:hypothetical protein